MKTILLAAAAALFLISPAFAHNGLEHDGCAAGTPVTAGDLVITGAFTRALNPSAKTGGGYFTIENTGTSAETLLGATTEAAASTQLHQMQMEGDIMRMSPVDGGLEIPAGQTVTLEPKGTHLMMMGVGTPFKEGECVELTLNFAVAGAVPIKLSVGGRAATEAPMGEMDHSGM
ncbi:MAG: copper chaperone PCu(A)C [Devosia sp.]|nr:copper chaperone PCu(A)C [Devosia sp.]